MCNLYRMTRTTDEIARLFDAVPDSGANFGEDVYPGYPGLVVAEGRARTMTWGFPLVLKGKQGQPLKPKPVNNAREDKLTSGFWRASLAHRRCLVPVTAWADAEGAKGRKTRTWYSLPDRDLFAVAGLWRRSQEWGDVYAMVMVDASPQMAGAHDRMPLILSVEAQQTWLNGEAPEALQLCRPWPGKLRIDRTGEPWAGAKTAARQTRLL